MRVTSLGCLLILALTFHDSEETFWPCWPFAPCYSYYSYPSYSYPSYSYPAYSYPAYQYSYPAAVQYTYAQPATTIIRESAPTVIVRHSAPVYEVVDTAQHASDAVPHVHVHRVRYMLVPVKKS
nr:unnamed protein product [Haemonchus contortus]